MTIVSVVSALLTLIAGIGIFLIACQMMSSNLESASSSKLKNLFSKASKSNLLGVGIGTLGTAAIQSSGAITVMVIGFVNAEIISLVQAATIIYGANIGTTITAQIVALGMFGENSLSTTVIFSAFAGFGAFVMLFAKKDLWKKVGGILTGFGMLFVGLSLMSSSMSDFAELDAVKIFLAKISNPILLVVIGALFTAIIQSSSVMTSVALAMVVTGLINLDQGIFITMGSNIGSCVVAIIAGVTSGRNAKRTALIHLIFNVFGVIVFLIVELFMNLFGGISFGYL
ncbi:MAG: Na/Pi cotransporter family protein, partial [Bacteroidales bacterium]|nr:Na/Pi cotransporter family protein [Bacteroidales bacterium]